MTSLDLRGVRELCEKATPAPWTWDEDECHDAMLGPPQQPEWSDDPKDAERCRERIITTDCGAYGPNDADRAFIAASRTLVPQLLALVEELQRARDEACDLLSSATACSCGMGVRCFDCANLDRLRAIGQRAEGGVK